MSDISDILDQLEKHYPKWLMDGLQRSPEIKNIEKALISMSKINTDVNKGLGNTAKAAKTVTGSFDDMSKAAKELVDHFDKASDASEDLFKAQSNLKKTLGGFGSALVQPLKDLSKGNISGAASELSYGLKSAAKELGGKGGLLLGGLGLFSSAISGAVEVVLKNNASYGKLAQSGFRIDDAFVGISKSAIAANLSLEDFTALASKNASVLAEMGPGSAGTLAMLSKSVRVGSDSLYRLGFDVEEVNDYLTDYLKIQQRSNFLNKITSDQMRFGFKEFIADAGEFSNIIGYARKDIIETAAKLTEVPEWDFFIRSLGDAGKNVQKSFGTASEMMASIAGPEYGGKLGSLLQDIVESGQAVKPENLELVKALQLTNSGLLDLMYSTANQVRAGKEASGSTTAFATNLVTSIKKFDDTTAFQLSRAKSIDAGIAAAMDSAVPKVKNFADRVDAEGGNVAAAIDKLRKISSPMADVFGQFNEAITAVKLAFETGFVSVLDANKPALLEFMTTIGSKAPKAILEFTKYIQGFMSGDTREQMIQAMADALRDVFHDIFPNLVTSSRNMGIQRAGEAAAASTATIKQHMIKQATRTAQQPAENVDAMLNAIIDRNEGGGKLVSDTGGLTKWGISSNANPNVDIANLTREQAIQIYKDKYISAIPGFNAMPQQTQMMALDAAINQGPAYANDLIRKSGGDVDRMIKLRKSDYADLAQANPAKYGKYLSGWNARVDRTDQMGSFGKYQSADAIEPTVAASTTAAAVATGTVTPADNSVQASTNQLSQAHLDEMRKTNDLLQSSLSVNVEQRDALLKQGRDAYFLSGHF
jgi:hypothetical protein